MDCPKVKGKKGIISKTWERCKSFSGGIGRKGSSDNALKLKSKSWPRGLTHASARYHDDGQEKGFKRSSKRVVPEGCFSIYVGPERERFVIKTEYVNHPSFKALLEEAESEYGYSSDGPLMLPCDVDEFVKVLMEMDSEEIGGNHQRCGFHVSRSHSSYHMLVTPQRMH